MIKISNEHLSVTINEKGAELQSIQLDGLEYMWQADAKYWAKHSPVLFPIIGELKDGKYIYEDKEYHLSRHGFARDKLFSAEKISGEAVNFSFQSDDETLNVYPFKFAFSLRYEIKNNELSCTYIVENIDDKEIYFSTGGHPAFRVPLNKNLQYNDYKLQFNHDEDLKRYVLHNGLTGDETETIHLDERELQLEPSLFYEDAIVLKHIKSDRIKLCSDKDPHGLNFNFEGFSYFGIWASKDAPFVCLEPWCGIADNIHHDGQLANKEGINKLNAGEKWQRTWAVDLF